MGEAWERAEEERGMVRAEYLLISSKRGSFNKSSPICLRVGTFWGRETPLPL